VPKSAHGLAAAIKSGAVVTEKKFGSANASAHSGQGINMRKLEESEETKVAKVDKSLSKAIMQARVAKKMNQKQLATAINEKPQVIGEYESGKAIPNGQIISKIERALNCRLPRSNKKGGGGGGGAKTGGSTIPKNGSSALTRGGPSKRR